MDYTDLIEQYKKAGQEWLKGSEITEWTLEGKNIKLFKNQIQFLNSKKRYCLYSGGFGSGKSLTLLMKMVFFCLFFPKNEVLLGRKTLQDIERTTLPALFDLLPSSWYKYRIKEGVITFFNGSRIILFGLDSLQTGSMADIKKAQQKIKSLNLGAYFLDQLEEIEKDVFEALNARLRRTEVPIRQGNMTTNPANFWAYEHFKVNPKKRTDLELIEGSMLDNRANLPQDYIEDQLNHDENYVKRFVQGIWSPDIFLKSVVFAEEYIRRFEMLKKPPVAIEEGFEIFEQPDKEKTYQIGIDPSEGAVDPSAISVVSSDGRKVAKFSGFLPIFGLIEKTKFIYYKYYVGMKPPLIIPEVNASGIALLEGIKDLKVYRRRVFEYREKREVEKQGWKTSYQSKQALISNFQNLLRKGFPKVYDKDTIEEFKTFCWTDSARQSGAGAEKGFHDDNVIATLLSFFGLEMKTSRTRLQDELMAGGMAEQRRNIMWNKGHQYT